MDTTPPTPQDPTQKPPQPTPDPKTADPKKDPKSLAQHPHPNKPITMVMSKLEAELAAERARVEAELAMAKIDRNKLTTKKIITIIIVAVAMLAIFGVLFWAITSSLGSRTENTDPANPDPTPGEVLPTIEGYHCTTELCSKSADLTEAEILVRDTAYYVYNRDTATASRTTIDPQSYRSFTPFFWKDTLLLILEPTTGHQGLFSITANRSLTNSFNYTSFNHDINSEAYQGMQWVEGTYILATHTGSARLIDIRTGTELASAAAKIYVDRDFIVGYEAEGQRRLYTMSGTRFLVVNAPSSLIIYDHHLIHLTGPKSFDIYDTAGAQLKSNDDYYRNLRTTLQSTRQDYLPALQATPGTFLVP